MKITKRGRYQTMEGKKVRIYAVDGVVPYIIHGALLTIDGWREETWMASGVYCGTIFNEHPYNLIAAPKPKARGKGRAR